MLAQKSRYFICFLLLLLLLPMQQAWSRTPSENRECATCHIMWLSEFKQQDVATLVAYDPRPVMNTGKQDVASNEDICFSCHDGFVLDSRFLWEEGKYAHPVGQKPSDKIKIPREEGKNIFPLNDEGRVYCGTCHSAHGVDWDQKEAAVFMRVRNVDGELCMACHMDKTTGAKHGMHPVGKKPEKKPENLLKVGAQLGSDGSVVCQSCHRPHAAPEKKFLLVKNEKSQLCGECHADRYAKNRTQAGHLGTHPVNIKPDRVKIPGRLADVGSKQGPAGEIICQTCHRPHQAVEDNALLIKQNNQGRFCLQCHKDKRRVQGTKHDMNLVKTKTNNIRDESVAEAGACSACHVPHGGTGPKMWARPVDKNQEPMAALCFSCHSEGGLAEKHTVGRFSHPVGVDINRLGHTVKLPTFSEAGFKWQDALKGKVSCASCHDPHQWDPNDELNKARPGDKSNNTNRFLRVANGADAALCKTCHNEKWNIAGSKHDMRFMAPDSTNTLGQTVEESGICGACHLVHNANGSRLWARSDLTGQGTGYVACLGCHNEKGLAKKKTLGDHSHPINVDIARVGIDATIERWSSQYKNPVREDSLTGGAPILMPLYDKDGRPALTGGRVGCGTCHNPHNWSVLDHKKADDPHKVEGDTSSSFLRIADRGLSSLCVNCHVDKKAIYFTKHDLTDQVAPINTQLPTTDVSNLSKRHLPGPCMHCHRPHNAKGAALWARDQGPAESALGKLCGDCHKEEGLAKNKIPGDHSHPLGVDASKVEHDERIPFFDSKGNRSEKLNARVDCASCHNPHQWDPNNINNRSLPLVDEEGDTTNSFLRLTANEDSKLCVSCHLDKKTVLGTDHDMNITSKNAKNKLKQSTSDSGVCGQCHVPHQANAGVYLWARELGSGQDVIEQRCRSCHDKTKLAKNKNPTFVKHPQEVKIWSSVIRQSFHVDKKLPNTKLFSDSGYEVDFGSVTCASCHNPHLWDASTGKPGPGKNIEGDARNSFLRASSSENIVCIECHGNDAIYRYKYFHGEASHKKHHMFK